MKTDFFAKCLSCGIVLKNWSGSTLCCGSVSTICGKEGEPINKESSSLNMSNIPPIIYLTLGSEDIVADFNNVDSESITWCTERVNKSDLEYVFKQIIESDKSKKKETFIEICQRLSSNENMSDLVSPLLIRAADEYANQLSTSVPVSEEEKNVYRSEGWDECTKVWQLCCRGLGYSEPSVDGMKAYNKRKEEFLSSFLPKKP